MDVDAAMRRQFENLSSEDLPVGGDDDQVGMHFRQSRSRLRRPQAWGLENREAETKGGLLHRRGGEGAASASRPIRLGDYPNDTVGRRQGFERWDGESRRA